MPTDKCSNTFTFAPHDAPGWACVAAASKEPDLAVWSADADNKSWHKQLFSLNLSSACTALTWIALVDSRSHKSARKRWPVGGGGEQKVTTGRAMALGTQSGEVLLLSLQTGQPIAHFRPAEVHTDRVNHIMVAVGGQHGDQLYTASSDGTIGRWNMQPKGPWEKFHWQSGYPVLSLCLHPSRTALLSGSIQGITWWDLASKKPLNTFSTGHIGAVGILVCLDDQYLITAGLSGQDRTVHVWSAGTTSSQKLGTALARFAVPDCVQSVSGVTSEQGFALAVVCSSGSLFCFDHLQDSLCGNRSKRKPIPPRACVALHNDLGRMPILDAHFIRHQHPAVQVLLCYGLPGCPVFEAWSYDQLHDSMQLLRRRPDEAAAVLATVEKPVSNNVALSCNVTDLMDTRKPVTENMVHEKTPSCGGGGGGAKVSQRALEGHSAVNRQVLLLQATPEGADSVTQLLAKGLHSKDKTILKAVFDKTDDDQIVSAVQSLSVEAVLPVIKELLVYIKNGGLLNQSHTKWLRAILNRHTAHLITDADCVQALKAMHALLLQRTRHLSSILQLKGKLDLMTRQLLCVDHHQTSVDTQQSSIWAQHDDSSDELSEVLEDLLLPESETEDVWQDDGAQSESDGDTEEEENEEDVAIRDMVCLSDASSSSSSSSLPSPPVDGAKRKRDAANGRRRRC